MCSNYFMCKILCLAPKMKMTMLKSSRTLQKNNYAIDIFINFLCRLRMNQVSYLTIMYPIIIFINMQTCYSLKLE